MITKIKQFFIQGVGQRFFQSAKSKFKQFTFYQKCFWILFLISKIQLIELEIQMSII